jgi:hypothetical protein
MYKCLQFETPPKMAVFAYILNISNLGRFFAKNGRFYGRKRPNLRVLQ